MAFQQAGLFEWRTRREEHRAPAGAEGLGQGRAAPPRARDARPGEAERVRRSHAVAALRRHAAARGDRARAGGTSCAAVDGRAVRRAGRDDPRAHAGRAAAHLPRDRHHRRVRDPLDPRGRLPLDARGRDVAASRTDHRRDRRRPRVGSRLRHARGGGVLREDHPGARGAPRHGDHRHRARGSRTDEPRARGVPQRLAPGRVRPGVPAALAGGRAGLRLAALLPPDAVIDLDGVPGERGPDLGRDEGLGHERAGRLAGRHRLRRGDQLPARTVPAAERPGRPRSRSRSTPCRSSCWSRSSTTCSRSRARCLGG